MTGILDMLFCRALNVCTCVWTLVYVATVRLVVENLFSLATEVTANPTVKVTCSVCVCVCVCVCISFTSTVDYTRVNLARSSPWLTGMYTSNRKYMNPGTNKGGTLI